MKVNYNFVILILVLGFVFYMLSIKEKLEHFESKCTKEQIEKAYLSGVFKPRRPEHLTCVTQTDVNTKATKTICNNKKYKDDEIKQNFQVSGVPRDCILELVTIWNW